MISHLVSFSLGFLTLGEVKCTVVSQSCEEVYVVKKKGLSKKWLSSTLYPLSRFLIRLPDYNFMRDFEPEALS